MTSPSQQPYRLLAGTATVLLCLGFVSGCTTHPAPTPTDTPTPTATTTPSPTSSPTPTPSPTPSATATPTAKPSASGPDEGQSFESSFLSGASAACGDLASAANNQQVVDTQGRVIDTTNCAALVKQVPVDTSGVTSKSAAYQAGYNAALKVLFAHEPLCDPQNNCITKADLGG